MSKKSIKGLFDKRAALENALHELQDIGLSGFSVNDEAGRYETLTVFCENADEIGKISDVLLRCGGKDIFVEGFETGYASYQEYSVRSRLNPERLTDI